jgi:hypothetical protein
VGQLENYDGVCQGGARVLGESGRVGALLAELARESLGGRRWVGRRRMSSGMQKIRLRRELL